MPKISDIEETPNPNAVKFILREPVSNGVARQYGSADQAENDPLAKSLFDVGHVVSVFYMDRMITVEKDEEGDWDELLPALAVPIRATEAVSGSPAAAAVRVRIRSTTANTSTASWSESGWAISFRFAMTATPSSSSTTDQRREPRAQCDGSTRGERIFGKERYD